MKKSTKITICIGIIVIIVLLILIFIFTSNKPSHDQPIINTETLIEEDIPIESQNEISNGNFEQDVMNDLESFFNNGNGYENIQGEFGFINTDE